MCEIVLHNVVKRWRSADTEFELTVPNVRLRTGELVVVIGPNGTGKSTLLELVGLAAAPDEGDAVFQVAGRQVEIGPLWWRRRMSELARLRARHFGYVLQTALLLPFCSIRRNAELAQEIAQRRDPAYLAMLFDKVGLNGREDFLPAKLSPGLCQRAAIARALAHKPDFILADEPTAALDPEGGQAALDLLLWLAREAGAGILMASHDRQRTADLSLRRLQTVLNPGSNKEKRRATVEELAA